MAVKMVTSKKMSMDGEAATNRITGTAVMVDTDMAEDTVATNCTMSPGAATEVDMEVTNPVMVAGMEVTDVRSMEDTEVTNPGTVAGMADTEVTETVTADMGDTDTIRGMAMDLLMEA